MANGSPQTYNTQTGQWEDFTPPPTAPVSSVTPYQPGQGTGPGSPTLITTTPNYTTPAPTPAASVAGTNTAAPPGSPQTAPYASVAGGSSQTPSPQGLTPETAPQPTMSDTLAALGPSAAQYGTSAVNPSQNAQLASQYNQYFAQTSGSAPNSSPTADINQAITSAAQPDPQAQFFDSVASQNPIVAQLYQMTQNIVSPQKTQESFTQEYAQLSTQAGIPQLQNQLLNYQTMMNGTTDDVRAEITAAGGFATESQVNAISATRNNVLMKQATQLEGQLSNQQQYVSNIMQYSQADQTQVNTQVNEQTGLLETMASLQQTMNSNAVANYQKTLTTLGGDYGAFASTVPNSMKPTVENLMGLAPGTLSSPGELQILTNSSLKLMQLQIAAQRANVYAYNAGYPITTPNGQPQTNPNAVSPFSPTNSISNPSSGSSYTVQQGDGLRAIAGKYGITTDAGLQAIAQLNGLKDINSIQAGQTLTMPIPVKLNSDQTQVGYIDPSTFDPSIYTQIGGAPATAPATTIDKSYQSMYQQVQQAQTTPVTGSPLNKGRYTRNANSALKNYIANPVYTAVSSGATYLARIQAAMKDPGSISDTSLADSIIKIETGGGQVTEAQLNTYFAGQSFSDAFAIEGDKIVAKGGVLSPQQRTDLSNLADGVFSNYKQQYEQLYVQAMTNLQGQGIPLNYGGNLPDFLSLIDSPTTATQ